MVTENFVKVILIDFAIEKQGISLMFKTLLRGKQNVRTCRSKRFSMQIRSSEVGVGIGGGVSRHF